jgi:hypothetical protein
VRRGAARWFRRQSRRGVCFAEIEPWKKALKRVWTGVLRTALELPHPRIGSGHSALKDRDNWSRPDLCLAKRVKRDWGSPFGDRLQLEESWECYETAETDWPEDIDGGEPLGWPSAKVPRDFASVDYRREFQQPGFTLPRCQGTLTMMTSRAFSGAATRACDPGARVQEEGPQSAATTHQAAPRRRYVRRPIRHRPDVLPTSNEMYLVKQLWCPRIGYTLGRPLTHVRRSRGLLGSPVEA